MRFGAHVFIAPGPRKAVEAAAVRSCEAVQIFSSNPRGWALPRNAAEDDEVLRGGFADLGIAPVLVHTPYLVNIAAADPDVLARSVGVLVQAAERARRHDGYVVVHAGRAGAGTRPDALDRASASVRAALKLVPGARILIEPTAGGRGSVASTVGETAELLRVIDDPRVGLCLDTCHAHAAGHDLSTRARARSWLDAVDAGIGLHRVLAVHANDSRDAAGSCRDRHWHVGEGTIGRAGMRAVLTDPRLDHVAVILETPGDLEDDLRNLAVVRRLAGRGQRGPS